MQQNESARARRNELLQSLRQEALTMKDLDEGTDSQLLAVLELHRIADTLENIERILLRTFKA